MMITYYLAFVFKRSKFEASNFYFSS